MDLIKLHFISEKESGFLMLTEIDGKTIYVSISKEMIVNERPHWNSGAHRVNDDVDIHYSVEWD